MTFYNKKDKNNYLHFLLAYFLPLPYNMYVGECVKKTLTKVLFLGGPQDDRQSKMV